MKIMAVICVACGTFMSGVGLYAPFAHNAHDVPLIRGLLMIAGLVGLVGGTMELLRREY